MGDPTAPSTIPISGSAVPRVSHQDSRRHLAGV